MAELSAKFSNCSYIICGDLNARTGEKPDFVFDDSQSHVPLPDDYVIDDCTPRVSQDKNVNSNGTLLLDFCKQSSLRMLNGRCGSDYGVGKFTCYTYNGQSTVDYVLASKDIFDRIQSFSVGDPNIISDHCLISFSIVMSGVFVAQNTPHVGFTEDVNCVDYVYRWCSQLAADYKCRINSNESEQVLQNVLTNLSSCQGDNEIINTQLNVLVNHIESCACQMRNNIRTRSESSTHTDYKDNNLPWLDEECAAKRREFYRHLNIFRGEKCIVNRQNMITSRSNYRTTLRNARFKYNEEQTYKLLSLRTKNAKAYWKLLRSAVCKNDVNICMTDFADFFRDVNNPDDIFYSMDDDIAFRFDRFVREETQAMFGELDTMITLEELMYAINQLGNGKSAGPDKILNEFLVHGTPTLFSVLHTLFNIIFDKGYFPELWSLGDIIPLHKKGSVHDVGNYRGITLLSTIGKLFK
ncbi:uncharacterized protein LOC144433746 [Glandiceps talaboti]